MIGNEEGGGWNENICRTRVSCITTASHFLVTGSNEIIFIAVAYIEHLFPGVETRVERERVNEYRNLSTPSSSRSL